MISPNLPNLMMRPLIALCTSLLLAAGCATVQTDYDAQVNIHNYHSYLLESVNHHPDEAAFNNPLNEKRLRTAVETNLATKGLHPVAEGATPDCIVRLSFGSRQVVENEPSPVHFGLGWGGYHRGFGGSMAFENDVHAYNDHRISVDLLDAKTRDPLWHVTINEDLNRLSGASAATRINQVVAEMFAKFP